MGRNTLAIISASCAIILFVVAEIARVCLCANSSNIPCIERERQALLKFKASQNYDLINRLSSWKGVYCCQWKGIGCDNLTSHVVMLDLNNLPFYTCLRSSLPNLVKMEDQCKDLYRGVGAANVSSSLMQLEYLTYSDLSGNDFYGSPIPTFIASMRRLRYLSLSHAEFGGKIPSSLGNLTNLHFLDLGHNDYNYDSQAHDIDWISGLQSLEHLDMSSVYLGNDIHNLIKVLNVLSLSSIYLDYCGIMILPLVDFTNAPKLQALSLHWNEFTLSNLDLQNLSSLVHLELAGNNLTSAPSWFGNFEKLEYLDLSFCSLGQIPDSFRNITSIESLFLEGNKFDSFLSWFRRLDILRDLIFQDVGFTKFLVI